MPRKPVLLVVVFGSLLVLLGALLSLTSTGNWPQLLIGSLFLCLSVPIFSYSLWLRRNPIFLVNAEGFHARYLANRFRIKWEEIKEITDHSLVQGMPLWGVLIKKHRGTSLPQEVFLPEGSFSLPTEQLLIQVQEQFRTQLAFYDILVHAEANHAHE
jgi:hypothetical protein